MLRLDFHDNFVGDARRSLGSTWGDLRAIVALSANNASQPERRFNGRRCASCASRLRPSTNDDQPIAEPKHLRPTGSAFRGPEKCREQIPCDGGDDEVGADFESPVRDNVWRLCCAADRTREARSGRVSTSRLLTDAASLEGAVGRDGASAGPTTVDGTMAAQSVLNRRRRSAVALRRGIDEPRRGCAGDYAALAVFALG